MKTEYTFIDELKAMMAEMPLDDISVSLLCKRCHVKRQTFYYHYHDIYDLLGFVFLNEKIDKISRVHNPQELVACIYNYYLKNQAFLDATLMSAARDLFEAFINNACQTSFSKMIHENDIDKVISFAQRKNMARIFAYSYSNAIVFYLMNTKNKSVEGLQKQFEFLGDNYIKELIKKQCK